MDFTDPNPSQSQSSNPAPVGNKETDSNLKKSKTEAPTSGITKSAAQLAEVQSQKFTEYELDFVTLLDQHWNIHGVIPTSETAHERYGIEPKEFEKLISSPLVRKALEERGVIFPNYDPTDVGSHWRYSSLTPEQLIVANTMLDLLDGRSYKKKLQDLKISTKKWNAWLKQPAFAKYLEENTDSVLKNGRHEASLALMDKVQQGDLKAIQLYWEYTNHWMPQAAKTVDNQTGQLLDAQQLINELVEIIVDEIDDPVVGARVGDKLKGLITKRNIVQGLTGSLEDEPQQLNMPPVAKARELTPEIKALMNQGVGMEQ